MSNADQKKSTSTKGQSVAHSPSTKRVTNNSKNSSNHSGLSNSKSLKVLRTSETMLAQTTKGITTVSPDVLMRPDAARILAHESVHRAQYNAQGIRPSGNRRQLEQDANAGVDTVLANTAYQPRYAAPESMTLQWCPPGTECEEYPADFIGPLPEGSVRAPAGDPEIVQIPEEDVIQPGGGDFIVAASGGHMLVLPAAGNYVQLRVPEVAPRSPTAPIVTMPTIGKNAMRIVNVGNRTGFSLDAGGRPAVVFPGAMSQIQSTLGVQSISGVLIMHIHQDHVESLHRLVTTHNIQPENIHVPAAFSVNEAAPSSDLARTMRTLETRFGPDARFGSIQAPTGSTGVFHTRLVEGEVIFDMYGLTGSFNQLERSRTRAEGQPNADRASLMVRTTHTPTGAAVLFLGDLRGSDLAEFRRQMTAEQYSGMMRGVRVVSGFQHHMGALERSADRAGLVEFLRNTLVANRGLTLVVQSQEQYGRSGQYLNRSLIEAVNRVGVDVHVAGEARSGGGAATVMSDSSISVSGQGVESFRAARGMDRHLRRLDRLAEAEEILSTQRHNIQNGEQRYRSISTARRSLETAINEYIRTSLSGVGSGATGRASATLTNEPAMARTLTAVEVEAPIEMELLLGNTMQQLREVRRVGPHLDTLKRELEVSRRTGRLSDLGIEALWEINPREAQRLVRTSGMPRREIRRVQQQLPGAPISGGRGAVGWGLIAVTVINEVGPAIAQYNRNAHNFDVGTFMSDIMFWQSTGMHVNVQAVDDNWWPYDNEYTTDVSRVNELVNDNEIDYLAMTGISDESDVLRLGNWDIFGLWVQNNIQNLGDWRALISNNSAIRSEGENITDRQWSYRTGSISGTTLGISLDIEWQESPDLTRILNAAAGHVVRQSTREIEAVEEGTGPTYNVDSYRAAPPQHSHRALYDIAPQALGLVRFRSSVSDPELYTLYNQRSRSASTSMLLYRFPDSASPNPVPEGYVVVGGANYNSYVHVSATSNYIETSGINAYGNTYNYVRRMTSEFLLAQEEDLTPATRSD